MNAIGVIPARLESSRLPRKLLLPADGKPLLQHTYLAALGSRCLSAVLIATDSDEIAAAARAFGAPVVHTGPCESGTARVAAALAAIDAGETDLPAETATAVRQAECVVNVQGDEPELDPAVVDRLVDALRERPEACVATACTPILDASVLADPACVKVVLAADGRALYFSRSAIPFVRDSSTDELLKPERTPWRLHLGVYAYRRQFLLRWPQLPPSPLERLEKLEQLRVLEAGGVITVIEVAQPGIGIDTPADYARFLERLSAKAQDIQRRSTVRRPAA